jgi:transposase
MARIKGAEDMAAKEHRGHKENWENESVGFPTNGGREKRQDNTCRKEPIMAKRKFTREFKVSAVKLVNEQGYSPAEAARSLGVDPNSVRGWVAKFSAEVGLAPSGEGAMAAELRQLRKENARLRMEREILKKAAAFFAKEQP